MQLYDRTKPFEVLSLLLIFTNRTDSVFHPLQVINHPPLKSRALFVESLAEVLYDKIHLNFYLLLAMIQPVRGSSQLKFFVYITNLDKQHTRLNTVVRRALFCSELVQ